MSAPQDVEGIREALRASGRVSDAATLSELSGGVSCIVALVRDREDSFIVKVPLRDLAVKDEWIADLERASNEAVILEFLRGALGPVCTPTLRFYDTERSLLGESFFTGPPPTYKEELMAGRPHYDVASMLAKAASALHRMPSPVELNGPGPRRLFDQLRLDAYYRASAVRAPAFADALTTLIADTLSVSPTTLVHGDLTPKNVLVLDAGAALLDWEVVNVGDASFDLGTMTAHFFLKALREDAAEPGAMIEAARTFWSAYDGPADRARGLRHAAGVMIARLHGKSPVEYLNDAPSRQRVEEAASFILSSAAGDFDEVATVVLTLAAKRR